VWSEENKDGGADWALRWRLEEPKKKKHIENFRPRWAQGPYKVGSQKQITFLFFWQSGEVKQNKF
jgi:hypothetical protein